MENNSLKGRVSISLFQIEEALAQEKYIFIKLFDSFKNAAAL